MPRDVMKLTNPEYRVMFYGVCKNSVGQLMMTWNGGLCVAIRDPQRDVVYLGLKEN
jgi:hypothetical protein